MKLRQLLQVQNNWNVLLKKIKCTVSVSEPSEQIRVEISWIISNEC